MSKALSLSLIVSAFLVGTGFGFFLAPEYAGLKLEMPPMETASADGYADLRFLNTMGRHHRGAQALAAEAEALSKRPELVEFARAVQDLKAADLTQFAAWKQAWYQDSRPIEAAGAVNLGTFDADFDLRFLNALEEKITGAIAMAADQRRVSTRSEVLTYASELIRVQTEVLGQVRAWRKAWYGL